MKQSLQIIIYPLIFFIAFLLFFKAFQNPAIYYKTLGKISKNYVYEGGGERSQQKIPYIKVTNENLIQWDAEHYNEIRKNGYERIVSTGNDYIFAFFPLFPFLWKITGLSPIGIIFVNIFLYIMGLVLIIRTFKKDRLSAILLLSLPMMVTFLIPLTEALFFLLFSLAVWGYMKEKYWVYFVALCLSSLARNAFSLILPAIICTEILFLLKEHDIKTSLKRCFLNILPIIIGTCILVVIQYVQGSNSITKFLSVQNQWGHTLTFPKFLNLQDWSHETFGLNVTTLVIIGIPLLTYLLLVFLKQCNIIKKEFHILNINSYNKKDYIFILCALCCVAAISMTVLFQDRNLNGLSRYILATPYFAILFILAFDKVKQISINRRIISFITLLLITFLLITTSSYFGKFSFSYLGFLILLITLSLFLFQDFSHKKIYNLILYSNFIVNIIWTTYLFNMYISNGWIFT